MSNIYLDPDLEAKFLSDKTGCTIQQGLDFYDAETEFLEINGMTSSSSNKGEKPKEIDENQLILFISNKINIPTNLVKKMYMAEEEYFMRIGIIETNDPTIEKIMLPPFKTTKKEESPHNVSAHIIKNLKTLKNSGLEDDEEQVTYNLSKKYTQPEEFQYISKRLKQDKNFVLKMVEKNGLFLEYCTKKFQDDDEIVFTAVNANRLAFQYASERLRNNRELAMVALKKDGQPLHYIGKSLINDKELILTAIESHGASMQNISEELRDDKEVMMKAVKHMGWNLKYASDRLKDDKELVMLAINGDFYNLAYASERLKNDIDIVLYMIANPCVHETFVFVGKDILHNQLLFEKIIEIYPDKLERFLYGVFPDVFDNEEIATYLIDYDGKYLKFVPETLSQKKNLIKIALRSNEINIFYASLNILLDNEFIKNNIHNPEIINQIQKYLELYNDKFIKNKIDEQRSIEDIHHYIVTDNNFIKNIMNNQIKENIYNYLKRYGKR